MTAPAVARQEPVEYQVEAARLDHGDWSECKKTGEGDIVASYSADKIANGGSVRKPFAFQGSEWVCVGSAGSGAGGTVYAEAYRLVPRAAFVGETNPYNSRKWPGYHGMEVKHGGKPFVLCGPAARFVPGGEAEQMSFF